MGTHTSDVMYAMLDRRSPLRTDQGSVDARVIAHRWEFHKPFALIEARQAIDPAAAFAFLKSRHAEYLTRLRRALIAPDVIIRHSLDDPRQPSTYFDQRMAEAVERRRARLGRVKGRVKPPHRIRTGKSNRKDTK